MYLKTCVLILLLFPVVQKKPKAPVCAVEGQWQLDKVRSPQEKAENIVWTLKIRRKRIVWEQEVTRGDETTPYKYIYEVGESSGRYENGTRWFRSVEFDENRLLVRRRFFTPDKLLQDWRDSYFEVKDRGYTLYYRQKWGKDVTAFEKVLYFRPVKKKKK